MLLYSSTIDFDVVTPDYVKEHYLTGLFLKDENGEELPDSWFIEHIANAIAKIEEITSVDILQRSNVGERHDYSDNDYDNYAFLQLFRTPALSVSGIRARYDGPRTALVYPTPWVRLIIAHAQLQLVPTSGTIAQVLLGQSAYMSFGASKIPQLWEVDYVSGFDPHAVPRTIVEAIGKMASIEMLKIMSDTVSPIGQTSSSLSLDGMSQSKGFNVPAFKARIDAYGADLGLPPSLGGGLLSQIRNKYCGLMLASL